MTGEIYTTRGMYIAGNTIEHIGSFSDKLSLGWPRFYYKGLGNVAVIRVQSTATVIVTVPDIMPTDKQTEIYDKIVGHPKFGELVRSVPEKLIGTDLIIDSDTLEILHTDSFMELLPANLQNQLFIITSEGENGEEIDTWPPMKIVNQDSTSIAVMLATFSASKRCHKPLRGAEWTVAGKYLLISLCAEYYEHKLNHDTYTAESLANRQRFYVPKKDRPRLVLPADALVSVDALTREVHTQMQKDEEKAKKDALKKQADEKAKSDAEADRIAEILDYGPKTKQPPLLPEKKALFLTDLLQIGVDTYLKGLEDHKAVTVEIDMQLEPSLHIKSISLFGGAMLIDTGGEQFDGDKIAEMFGTDTEKIFSVAME